MLGIKLALLSLIFGTLASLSAIGAGWWGFEPFFDSRSTRGQRRRGVAILCGLSALSLGFLGLLGLAVAWVMG